MSLILKSCVKKNSIINGGKFWEITWLDTDTFEDYVTTVDESYSNFVRCGWDKIVNDLVPYGIYEKMKPSNKVTNKGKTVISADQKPQLITKMKKTEIDPLIAELITNELMRRGEL